MFFFKVGWGCLWLRQSVPSECRHHPIGVLRERYTAAHTSKFGVTDISTEIDLILARASLFSKPTNLAELTICPKHRCNLGTGWRRRVNRCRIPEGLAKHKNKRSIRRGIRKRESKAILRSTGVFVPVGSGR